MKRRVSIKKLKKSCDEVCLILKSLSHPQRLLIMAHLLGGEKTVTELVKLSGVSQPQISQFLMRMKSENLIRCRRQGKFQYYGVTDRRLANLMKALQSQYCR
jgi:DNA-binding transcriptional ArsR family regulator